MEKTSRVILSEPFKDIKEPKQKKIKKKPKDKTAKETEVKLYNCMKLFRLTRYLYLFYILSLISTCFNTFLT